MCFDSVTLQCKHFGSSLWKHRCLKLLSPAGGAKKCIKVGGEFYSSGKLDETAGVHKAQTAQNYVHQQGEPSTRVMDVGDRNWFDSWKITDIEDVEKSS